MRRLIILPLTACFGAGVVAGLLHFLTPPFGLALLVVGWMRIGRPHGLLLGAVAAGALLGFAARLNDRLRCETVLTPGPVALDIETMEPADRDAGVIRIRPRHAGCRGVVSARWLARDGLEAGQVARVSGRWSRAAEHPRVRGVLRVDRVEPRPSGGSVTARWRGILARRIDRLYGRRAPLIDALILNRKGRLDPLVRDEFARAGLVHILAISGFHVGLVALWLGAVLRLLRIRRAWIGPLSALGALGYVAFLGWPASATRAGILIALVVWARTRQRRVGPAALLGATVLLFLLVSPWVVIDVGAWLSVSALAGVIVVTRWAERRLGATAVGQTLAASLGATLATAPITAGLFGVVSLVGLGLNFAALPLAALALPGAIASVLLEPLPGPAAAACASGAGLILDVLEHLAHWGAAIPHGHITQTAGLRAAIPWVGVLLLTMWLLGRRNTVWEAGRRLAWAAVAGLWIALVLALGRAGPDPLGELRLHFLDVGQGDAAAIVTPHGRWVLVDGGPRTPEWDAGRGVVAPFLRRHGVSRLSLLVVSHADADHLGGVPWVVEHFRVDQVLEPGSLARSGLYLDFLDELDRRAVPWHVGRAGATFAMDGVTFSVLHPDTTWAGWGEGLNEDSVVLQVKYGDFEALFTGDIGFPAERAIRAGVRAVEVLKVGHHGSAGSTGREWLASLRPGVAVISVGRNRYGHPAPAALARLAAAGAEVWRTDHEGTILVATDGTRVTVQGREHSRTFTATP